jgi:hypothetical protein
MRRAAEIRSLALLVEVASETRDGHRVLRRQSRSWPRRLRRTAIAVADAWERGEPLPEPFSRQGEPALAARLVSAREDEASRARHAINRAALVPVISASFALMGAAVVLGLAAPPVHALVAELAATTGSADPSALLALLARHAPLILVFGGLGSIAVLLAPMAARRPRGILRSALATRDFAARLVEHLHEGRAPHEATARAAHEVSDPWARARFLECARRLSCGESAGAVFDDRRVALLAPLSACDGEDIAFIDAARDVERIAREQSHVTAASVGVACAVAGYAATAVALGLLLAVVLIPLVTLGMP